MTGWTLRGRSLVWGDRTYVMGILNVTPDSFSDGGQFETLPAAIAQAQQMVAAGVDLVDVGGQSTRPGAAQIDLAAELARVVPVITAIRAHADPVVATVPISVDTTRAAVAAAAIAAGADVINDISGGTYEPEILAIAAQTQTPIILMHIRGVPQTMQQLTDYHDLVGDIQQALTEQAKAAIAAGVPPAQICLDPGIGFAKTADQNLELLRRLPELRALGYPLLVGPSRKSFIGKILDEPDPQRRVWGTAAACCAAIAGGANILRVHDVAEMVQVCRVADALQRS